MITSKCKKNQKLWLLRDKEKSSLQALASFLRLKDILKAKSKVSNSATGRILQNGGKTYLCPSHPAKQHQVGNLPFVLSSIRARN